MNHRSPRHSLAALTALLVLGCTPKSGLIGEIDGSTGGVEDTDAPEATGPTEATTEGGSDGSTTAEPEPLCCQSDICGLDVDGDGVVVSEDNAPDVYNPSQADQEVDGFADAIDLCPSIATPTNTADSDRDGIGNACDRCAQTPQTYNEHAEALDLPMYLRVRNNPRAGDIDFDGVGDACDNCPQVPNCGPWGPDNPHPLGAELPELGAQCQRDDDQNMVGDACDGQVFTEHAAGPVGLGPADDFDQDGVRNDEDGCPRLPLRDTIACTGPEDCPEGRACTVDGICNHLDSDEDGIGDACDTCSAVANPQQVVDGEAQADDEDGDFVGAACETVPSCAERDDPLRLDYRAVSVEGLCCTLELDVGEDGTVYDGFGSPYLGPDGVPIRTDCSAAQEEAGECRALPQAVAERPGVIELPPGCEQALLDAKMFPEANGPLSLLDVEGDADALQAYACLRPQLDHDFDGIGDACDLCPFAFDPDNLPYIDPDGRLWSDFGKYCSGVYDPDAVCE